MIQWDEDVYKGEWLNDKAQGYEKYIHIDSKYTQGNGKKTNSMGRESSQGHRDHNMTIHMILVRSMDLENIFGLIYPYMKDNLRITIYKEEESILGMMGECLMAIGRTIKWKERGYLHGQMGGGIREIILMIRCMVMTSFIWPDSRKY